jgi:hypothetical protein
MADQYQMGIRVPTTTQVSVPGGPVGYIPTWEQPQSGSVDAAKGDPEKEPSTTDTPPAEDEYTKYLKAEQARLETLRVMNAKAVMEAQMAAYGLGALASRITEWITKGYEPDAIMALVRQSDEYAARFPAMKALQAKNRGITESEYIAYEQTMAGYERMFGLPSGMLTDKNMITKLLTNELSAREVEDRATRSAASMYSLPQEFRDTMRRYYGVDTGGLTAYFLDPDVAAPLLEKQFVSAQIGMEATLKGVTVDMALSESLYGRGVDRDKAAQGFGLVAATSEAGAGRGDVATQEQRIGAYLTDDEQGSRAVERALGARKNRFAGGGGFKSGDSGVSSLGSSST